MAMKRAVFYIKLIHILLFFLIIASTGYVFITALIDRINPLTWWALGIVMVEMAALMINDWRCPLTDLAEKKGAEVGSVADLFLPRWFSEHLFFIFGIVFMASCLLLGWRLLF